MTCGYIFFPRYASAKQACARGECRVLVCHFLAHDNGVVEPSSVDVDGSYLNADG